ncbi:MAG: biotin/lipoyl-binding protein, partial [Acidobacteria bacterium]|nr:biotin/lipoyl-binding protein [Acidobacteriota bacterium]
MRNSNKGTIPRAMMLSAGCSLSLLLTGCQRASAPPTFDRPPAPVAVAAAITQNVPIYIDAIGKCAALEVVTVQPQVSGRITQIQFADGAELKKGDA